MQTHKNSSCRFWLGFYYYLSVKRDIQYIFTTEVPIFEKYDFQVVRSTTWPCQIEDGNLDAVGVEMRFGKSPFRIKEQFNLVDKLNFQNYGQRGRDHRLYF
jgi:hypothetical protein